MSPSKQQKELIRREKLLSKQNRYAEQTKERARRYGEETRSAIRQLAENNHRSSRPIVLFLVFIAIVILLLAVCVLQHKRMDNEQARAQLQNTQNELPQQIDEELSLFTDGCVFPDSSERYLSPDEVASIQGNEGYTRRQVIQFAINELYARNHMSFETDSIHQYYDSCTWYSDGGLSAEDALRHFNTYEKYNLNLLVKAREDEKRSAAS